MKKNARRTSVKKSSPCPICRAPAVWIFRRKVLASFPADMHLCPHCDYMFLAKPGWLKDAYTRVINSMDTGCLERIIRVRDETALPIYLLRGGRGPWLDYGGDTVVMSG